MSLSWVIGRGERMKCLEEILIRRTSVDILDCGKGMNDRQLIVRLAQDGYWYH